MHPINTGIMLKCTLTHLPPTLRIFLHLCLSLTLGPVNAGDQQSCTSVRYQIGNGVYCITPHPPLILQNMCVHVCVC